MKLTNQQKGAIGETAVVLELLKRGFNVININNSYQNYENADLICMNPNNGKSVKVQVKTGTTQNIFAGFTSETNGIVPNLEEKIFIIDTLNTTYAFKIAHEKFLAHLMAETIAKSPRMRYYERRWIRNVQDGRKDDDRIRASDP